MKKATVCAAVIKHRGMWLLISTASAAAVIVLTITPGRSLVIALIHSVLDRVWWGDLIGHTALMGALTTVLYGAARLGMRRRFSSSLAFALVNTLAISGITEVLQIFSDGRTADRADLMANLLGVFVAVSAICYQRVRVLFRDESI